MINTFLTTLPKVASQPLALIAYACIAGIWLFVVFRQHKSKTFLKSLELLPKQDRSDFARNAGYKYDELASLNQKERLNLLTKRYRLIAYVITLVAILVIAVLIALESQQEHAGLKREFDKLTRMSTKMENAAMTFRMNIEAVKASSDTAARLLADPELKRVAEELKSDTEAYDAEYHSQLTPQMTFQLRLFKASAANALGKYEEAQQLVPDEDVQQQTLTTITMLFVQADAAFGLNQFKKSADIYEKILVLQPDNIRALLGIADCQMSIGQFQAAINIHTAIVNSCIKTNSPMALFVLSRTFHDRGLAWNNLRRFSNSIADFTSSIKIAEIVKTNDAHNLKDGLWILYKDRGDTYCALGDTPDALADHDYALKLSSMLQDPQPYNGDYRSLTLLNSIGIDYLRNEQYSNALININSALRLLGLTDQVNEPRYSNSIALMSMNLGFAYSGLDDQTNALINYNKAIDLYYLLDSGPDYGITISLIKCLYGRANLYANINSYDNAVADYNDALSLIQQLGADRHPELEDLCALCLSGRGSALFSHLSFQPSVIDYSESIDLYKRLLDNGRLDMADDFAKALAGRGLAYTRLLDYTNGMADYDQSLNMWRKFIELGHPDATNELPPLLVNRSACDLFFNQPTNALLDSQKAVIILSGNVRHDPAFWALYCMALSVEGMAYDQIGQFTNAVAAYTELWNSVPHMTSDEFGFSNSLWELWGNCANDCKRLHQATNSILFYSRALTLLETRIKEQPSLQSDALHLLRSRGLTYFTEGAISNAICDFESSARNGADASDRQQAYGILGMLYAVQNNDNRSSNYLMQCLDLNTNQNAARFANDLLSLMQTNGMTAKCRAELMARMQKAFLGE